MIVGDVDTEPVPGKPVKLTNCRMVLYWASECGGLFGLAANGPRCNTRITESLAVVVETVWCEWCAVSDVAVERIDKWTAS